MWPQRHGPTRLGDGESPPDSGRCLRNAYLRWRPPAARAHRSGGRGVMPRRWLLPKERLWGMAAPCGAGPPARGTGSPGQAVVAAYGARMWDLLPGARTHRLGDGDPGPTVVAAYGAPTRDGIPKRHGPTGWGNGECYLGGGRFLRSAYGGWQPLQRGGTGGGGGARAGAVAAGAAALAQGGGGGHALVRRGGPCAGWACVGERRGRLCQPSSLGVAGGSDAQAAGTRGPRDPRGWCFALGLAHT